MSRCGCGHGGCGLTYDLQHVAQCHVDIGGNAPCDGVAVAGQAADQLACKAATAAVTVLSCPWAEPQCLFGIRR